MKNVLLYCFCIFLGISCTQQTPIKDYESETLKIKKLTTNTYIHTSYLNTKNYKNIPCNGLIFAKNGEAIVFDTPTTDSVSNELITWIENTLSSKVKAVVPGHFHVDCLGGLNAFHQKGITSYANALTLALADSNQKVIPRQAIQGEKKLSIGGEEIICKFFGGGHTFDNIVSYIPTEKTLFGGCLIKSLKSGRGNIEDADIEAWPKTVAKIKDTFPDVQYIVPGHGSAGNTELLDFTIELFNSKADEKQL